MQAYYSNDLVQIFQGDTHEILSYLPEGSIDTICTSPPYFKQRRYPAEANINWADGKYQYGAEKSPEQYIAHTLEFFELFKRVLKKTGSVWWNIDDSRDKKGQLLLIPQRLAITLQSRGWVVASYVCWVKSNPLPENVQRRATDSYETILMLAKSRNYFYDIEAVRQPFATSFINRLNYPVGVTPGSKTYEQIDKKQGHPPQGENLRHMLEQSGSNIWNVWAFPGACVERARFGRDHYAVFPIELPRRAILAGCPPHLCSNCGLPYKRIIEKSRIDIWDKKCDRLIEALEPMVPLGKTSMFRTGKQLVTRTVGWEPGCKCGVPKEFGVVLDPFAGTGTTGVAAKLLGRRSILIDVVPDFCKAARMRVTGVTAPLEPITREWEPEPEKEAEGVQLGLFGGQDGNKARVTDEL